MFAGNEDDSESESPVSAALWNIVPINEYSKLRDNHETLDAFIKLYFVKA